QARPSPPGSAPRHATATHGNGHLLTCVPTFSRDGIDPGRTLTSWGRPRPPRGSDNGGTWGAPAPPAGGGGGDAAPVRRTGRHALRRQAVLRGGEGAAELRPGVAGRGRPGPAGAVAEPPGAADRRLPRRPCRGLDHGPGDRRRAPRGVPAPVQGGAGEPGREGG